MAKLGKYVLASRIAKQMIAEKLEECDFQRPELIEPEDPQLKKLREKNPPNVEDKTKAESGVAAPKETAPKGKHVPKSVSDKDLKNKYTDMTNYVPAKIKRSEKNEIPIVTFDFDDSELEPETEKELEDYFDKKHIIKLKETIGGGSKAALDRLNQKTPGHPNFRGPAPVKNGVTDYSSKPLSDAPPKEKPKNEFFKPAPTNQQHMMSQKKTGMADFWKEANEAYPYNGSDDDAEEAAFTAAAERAIQQNSPKKVKEATLQPAIRLPSDNAPKPSANPVGQHQAIRTEAKKAKLGSGARFKAVEKSAAKSGAKNPAAVAAIAGMKKYGKKKMSKMAQAGKKK